VAAAAAAADSSYRSLPVTFFPLTQMMSLGLLAFGLDNRL